MVPHAGYHWDYWTRPFFEGWYYRVTLPEGGSFAFMYSIQQPGGGAVQIYGPAESYVCRSFPDIAGFWAWSEAWGLGHQDPLSQQHPGSTWLDPEQFFQGVNQGYQARETVNQGQLKTPTGEIKARWFYQIEPQQSWGADQVTGGWLSYLPLYDPGWQVLMAKGLATGWVELCGQTYEFCQVPAYAEKNWGFSFPRKWFWLQGNWFAGYPDLSITAAGGIRQLWAWEEAAGLVGLHYGGEFYEFAPWTNAELAWDVSPWGHWQLTATQTDLRLEIIAHCPEPPQTILVPARAGMIPSCWDTLTGFLELRLYKQGRIELQAQTHQAGLEIGGAPWESAWQSEGSVEKVALWESLTKPA